VLVGLEPDAVVAVDARRRDVAAVANSSEPGFPPIDG
jgi:hypothetical protein